MKIRISTHGDNESFIITPIDFSVSQLRGIKVYIKNLNSGFESKQSCFNAIELVKQNAVSNNIEKA